VSESQLNENDAVIHTAIRTLGGLQYTSPGFTERMLEALDNPETDLESRRSILLYAGSVRNAQMQEKLLAIVADADADLVMRSYAANSLGKIAAKDNGMKENRERSIKAMQAVLDEIRNIRDSRQRARMNMLKQQAILALIRMGDDSVKDELRAAAQDDDASMRLRAIRYIGELKLKEYRNLVEFKSKHDESPKVRKEAERVLKEL
jgi:HEAT repeat protein